MDDLQQKTLRALLLRDRLPPPTYELQFHPTRKWRFDVSWPDRKVALEVEGASWGTGKPCATCGQRKQGAHNRGKHFQSDIEKYNAAAALGWRVVRVTTEQLYHQATLELLRQVLS